MQPIIKQKPQIEEEKKEPAQFSSLFISTKDAAKAKFE